MECTAALDATARSTSARCEADFESVAGNSGCAVVIVGGGFAGAALAYHLLARSRPFDITLVERRERVGRGVAYDVEHPALRLNVPAARMSLDPARPGDFVAFAGAQADPNAYLARSLYGRYIGARLAQAQHEHRGRLHCVRATAVRVDDTTVWLDDGRRIRADRVVLATGLTSRDEHSGWPEDPRVLDAWDSRALSALPRDGRILLLGSGLSALDALSVLESGGYTGETVMLSRRGLPPRPHTSRTGCFAIPARFGPPPRKLTALLRWVRALVREAEATNHPWQHAIDALRPRISEIWQSLSARDRRRFIDRVRPYWEVLRHRAPADVLAMVEARAQRGVLSIMRGQVLHCSAGPDALELRLQLRSPARGGPACEVTERFSQVVRCTGPALEHDPLRSPLTAALLRDGYARPDCARLGIATGPRGQVLDRDGRPSDRLFALGQPCRASRWETTSVPEIVRDAVAMAELFEEAQSTAGPGSGS
jgi:uncharacterized NAD(P)/FAD-binding protein YdhS